MRMTRMTYYGSPLILEPTRLHDALGVIELSDLPDPEPSNDVRRPGEDMASGGRFALGTADDIPYGTPVESSRQYHRHFEGA